MIKFNLVTLTLFILFSGCAHTRKTINTINVQDTTGLRELFSYNVNDVPLISGHRGGIVEGYPENSIEAFENTLHHTPAFFEVDPRLTKDSIIILFHDDTLGRTSNGTGKVADHTWAQLKKLRLKDRSGNLTKFNIPTLDEAIKWSKGKTILNLDKKNVPLEMTAGKVQEHNAEAHVMITVHNAKQAKFYYEGNKKIMFSAFVLTKQALTEYEKEGIPWLNMMAYIGPRDKPENKELIDLLNARGVRCMISAASSYDKLKDPAERKKAYQQIIRSGVDVIESDLPIEVAQAIHTLKPSY